MKKLKLFFALFAMLALGVGNAWGETTISFGFSNWDGVTANFSGTAKDEVTQTVDGVKVTYTRNGSNLYANTTAIRFYKLNTLKFDAPTGYSIQSIAFTCSSYQTDITSNVGTCTATSSNLSWSGDATSVTFTRPSNASSYATITGATVTLAATSGGSTPDPGTGEGGEDPETPGTGGTVTYTVSSVSAVTTTGNVPQGSTAVLSGTGSLNGGFIQCTNGKNHTLTLTGYEGYMITGVTIHVKSNSSKGTGSFSVMAGSTTIASITESAFNTSSWNGSWNTTGVDKTLTMTNDSYKIQSGENVTLTINCKSGSSNYNSLYVKSYTITYKPVSSSGSGSEEPADCTPLTPTLSYESTTLLKSTTSSAPTLDGNTGEGTVTYTSSNTEVATVDAETGVITAVNAGTATITATIASSGEYCEGMATVDIIVKQLVSCADIYNLADEATFVLKDFVVTYVNGKYTYIKDDTGYGLIYKDSYGLIAGDQVASGKFEGERDSYNGLVEIIPTTEVGDLGATPGTAPDPEVMNTNPTEDDMNKYVKLENVSFASTAFSSKSINGTIEGQGSSIKFYDQFATNKTFDTNKKYDVIGVVSMFNSVQVNFISAEEVAEPTLNLTTTPIDFGKVAINSTNESTLQLSGSLLTKDITLSVEGDIYFTVSANSITPSEGSVNETITITYKPTVEGTHTATLKITSDELTEQTITLTGNAVEEYTVHFYVNGEEKTELAKTILSGNTLDALPEEPESCDPLTYPTFAGWTSAEIDGTTDVKPTMLDLSTPITSDCNYYAVFEKATVGGSSDEQTETINAASFAGITGTTEKVLSANSSTWTWNKGSGSNIANNEEIRLYANHTMTISPKDGCDISKIVVDINTGKPASAFADGGLSGASMTLVENTATLTPTSGDIVITQSNQSRVNSFVVTYTTSTITYEYITSCATVVPTCEITYDFAGGEGECTTDIVEKDTEYTLCATAPTKTGHTFLNWKDQNGDPYEAGATINSVTEDLTLTAQWQVNSYSVTWMSLGEEVLVNSTNYNTQPTKPATDPAYTCGTGKEFVGWTTQEIDGVGVPANLYTDEFPVVTEAITYHAVFASINSSAESTTHTLTPNNSWSGYAEGTITDNKGYTWSYCAAGTKTDGVYSLNLRNRDTETSYIGSPLFTANVKSIKATIVNGSASKARKVYVCSAPTLEPSTGDLGIIDVAGGHSGELPLAFEGTISQFYLQVSDALQFQSIVVEVGADPYTDYTTSCPVLELTEGDNSAVLEANNGQIVNVEVTREFTTGNLYTISLPFALNKVSDIFGNVAYEYSSLAKNGDDVVLYFSKVNTMEAGKPYLIEPTKDVQGFTVENVTLSNTTNNISFFVDATAVSMEAVLSASASANTEGKYWLASDKYLYNNSTTLKSLRALFTISTPSGIAPRVRVSLEENGETGLENITDGKNTAIKVIENGQLIIIRNGEKFNAQGQKL